MLRKFLLAVLATAALAPIAHAQTVDELIAKNLEARGGAEKLKAVQSMKMNGKMAMGPGMEAPFTMEAMRPGLFRMTFTLQGMTGIQAYDGKQGWMVMPFMGKKDPEAMSPDDSKEMKDQAEDMIDGPLVDWKTKGHTVEYVGRDTVDGAPTYKLKITKKNGNVTYEWLDAETYLEIKSASKRTIRGTEVDGEAYMSDYKDVGGLMMAHSMEQGAAGSPQRQKMTIDSVELNPKLDSQTFVMPAPPDTAKVSAPVKPAAKPDAAKPKKK